MPVQNDFKSLADFRNYPPGLLRSKNYSHIVYFILFPIIGMETVRGSNMRIALQTCLTCKPIYKGIHLSNEAVNIQKHVQILQATSAQLSFGHMTLVGTNLCSHFRNITEEISRKVVICNHLSVILYIETFCTFSSIVLPKFKLMLHVHLLFR